MVALLIAVGLKGVFKVVCNHERWGTEETDLPKQEEIERVVMGRGEDLQVLQSERQALRARLLLD